MYADGPVAKEDSMIRVKGKAMTTHLEIGLCLHLFDHSVCQ